MKTIEKETQIVFEEKKSKFIGYIKPVSTKIEAECFIEMIKKKHPDATHNCSAYKLIENSQEYYKVDDDGEPSGTAGKPMGEILNILEVYNVVVVATRYFGGVKLGAGGLIRNYAKTAKLAVLEANIIEYVKKYELVIDFPYHLNGEIDRMLVGNEIIDKGYSERVTYRVKVNSDIKEKLESNIEIIVI